MGPHLGHVERVEAVFRRLGHRHDLHLERPRRIFSSIDRLQQIALMVVGIAAGDARRILGGEALDPLIGLEVVLHPEGFAAGIDPLKSVRSEAVHVAKAGRNTSVAEQDRELMGRFGTQ